VVQREQGLHGFIERDDRGGDIFCHMHQVDDDCDEPMAGDKVTFIAGTSRDGRSCACRVIVVK
jgi:cold shock CspA family protein